MLDRLAREGLQSDRRYAESYLDSRARKGYGPARIRLELRERGVADELVEDCLDALAIDWMDILHSVREKKFGAAAPGGYADRARESRFLQHRGFSGEQIRRLYDDDD